MAKKHLMDAEYTIVYDVSARMPMESYQLELLDHPELFDKVIDLLENRLCFGEYLDWCKTANLSIFELSMQSTFDRWIDSLAEGADVASEWFGGLAGDDDLLMAAAMRNVKQLGYMTVWATQEDAK